MRHSLFHMQREESIWVRSRTLGYHKMLAPCMPVFKLAWKQCRHIVHCRCLCHLSAPPDKRFQTQDPMPEKATLGRWLPVTFLASVNISVWQQPTTMGKCWLSVISNRQCNIADIMLLLKESFAILKSGNHPFWLSYSMPTLHSQS